LVLDELSLAEQILKNQKLDDDHEGYDLSILAKYYIYQGNDYKKTTKLIEEFCIKNIKYFNIITRRSLIDYAINSAKKYKLGIPIDIIITHQEISIIQTVPNIDYQRFLFTLLVMGKQQKYNSTKTKFKNSAKFIGIYYNGGAKEIIKHAGLRYNENFKNKMMNDLYKLEFLDMVMGKETIVIKFASEGHPALVVNNFDNIGLYYLKYIGNNKIGECQNCHSLFMKRSNRQILCKECSEINEKESAKIRAAEHYEKHKNSTV